MADHHFEHGTMDVTEQEKTFNGFVKWSGYTTLLIFIVLAFLALTQT